MDEVLVISFQHINIRDGEGWVNHLGLELDSGSQVYSISIFNLDHFGKLQRYYKTLMYSTKTSCADDSTSLKCFALETVFSHCLFKHCLLGPGKITSHGNKSLCQTRLQTFPEKGTMAHLVATVPGSPSSKGKHCRSAP